MEICYIFQDSLEAVGNEDEKTLKTFYSQN